MLGTDLIAAATRRLGRSAGAPVASFPVADELWLRVDFADPGYAKLPPDRPVRAVVSVGDNAELLETRLAANPALEGWRTTLRLRRADAAKPVELRLQLFDPDEHAADRPRSETWSYVLPPE